MKPLFIIPSVLVLSLAAFAQDGAATAYCKYTVAQAEAQRDLLRNPSALVGPTQPSAGTPAQMVFGATVRVSNNLKASLTMKAAHAACDLYMGGVRRGAAYYLCQRQDGTRRSGPSNPTHRPGVDAIGST